MSDIDKMNAKSREPDSRASSAPQRVGGISGSRGARVLAWTRDILIVLGVYLGASLYQTWSALDKGTLFPTLELRSLDGRPASLSSYRGRPVMVHAWTTWCGVCRREFGSLAALAAAPPRDAAVVTIVVDGEDVERIRAFVQEHHIEYPVLLGSEAVAARLGVSAFPTTYYLDREGKVSSVAAGMSLRWAMWLRLWWAGWTV